MIGRNTLVTGKCFRVAIYLLSLNHARSLEKNVELGWVKEIIKLKIALLVINRSEPYKLKQFCGYSQVSEST